jgi:hypothetical protein
VRAATALAATAVAVAAAGCGRTGGLPFQPTLNTPLPLGGGGQVAQTLALVDEVSAVDLSVATYGGAPDPDGVLAVALGPVDGRGPATAVGEVAGADLADGAWVRADLGEVVEVDGPARITATWDGATPLALWANTTLEGSDGIRNDPYPAGQLLVDGRPVDGDLAFRLTGPASAGDVLDQAGAVGRTAAGRAAQDLRFAVGWPLALAGCAALAWRGLRHRR